MKTNAKSLSLEQPGAPWGQNVVRLQRETFPFKRKETFSRKPGECPWLWTTRKIYLTTDVLLNSAATAGIRFFDLRSICSQIRLHCGSTGVLTEWLSPSAHVYLTCFNPPSTKLKLIGNLMMSDALDKYRSLQQELYYIRGRHLELESEEEDSHLERMDEAWWQLTKVEREIISSEPPRKTPTHPSPMAAPIVDVDVENEPDGPVRRIAA
ncbi:MAG: hypothetical protein ACC661_11950 [Verrucomicrobiales bacterium]